MNDKLYKKACIALENLKIIADRNMLKFQIKMPSFATSDTGLYNGIKAYQSDDMPWHIGMWIGIYWNLYVLTNDKRYHYYASSKSLRIKEYIEKENMDSSDSGMLLIPAMMYSYKYEHNENSKKALLIGSDSMSTNYIPSIKCISSWENDIDNGECNIKVSDLVNLMLLRWACKVNNRSEAKVILNNCIDNILKYNICDDGSVYFRYYFDINKNIPLGGYYNIKNMTRFIEFNRARSVSWAIFGLSLNYGASKEQKFMDTFIKVAKKFFEDYNCDECCFLYNGKKSYDTASSLIAICGIMAFKEKCDTPCKEIDDYYNKALMMLEYIIDNNAISPTTYDEGFVNGSVNTDYARYTNKSTVIGDYFYIEAIMRYLNKYKELWY